MVISIPLFLVSIALFLFALATRAQDRRAWARRLTVRVVQPPAESLPAEPPPPVASPRGEVAPSLAGLAPRSLIPPPLRIPVPPPLPPHLKLGRPQLPAALPPSQRQAQVRAADSNRSAPRSPAASSTDEVTIVQPTGPRSRAPLPAVATGPRSHAPLPGVAPASLPRPPAPAGVSPRAARGTPSPPLEQNPSLPCWPVVYAFPAPYPRVGPRK